MDCPAEQALIRLRLEGLAEALVFDLPARHLTVWHRAPLAELEQRLESLGMGARRLTSGTASAAPASSTAQAGEARTLILLLVINAVMFLVEAVAGWWAESSGLLADALDMFADAAVYGVALYAVGRGTAAQRGAARLAGGLQLILAVGLFGQVARHVLLDAEPLGGAMMGVSVVALGANLACLALLARHRHGGAHLRASFIFSANDVLANLGVIVAGALVQWTGAQWPDWLVGGIIGSVVLAGALRILRLGQDPGPVDQRVA